MYASRLPTIDMCGLCDREVALRAMPDMGQGMAGHEKSNAPYVLSRRPEVILLIRSEARFSPVPVDLRQVPEYLLWTADHEMWAQPEFRRDYTLRSERLPGFYLNFFARNGAP